MSQISRTSLSHLDNLASRSQRAGVENAEALPNPWGGSQQQRPPASGASNEQNPLSGLLGSLGGGVGGNNIFPPEMLNALQANSGQIGNMLQNVSALQRISFIRTFYFLVFRSIQLSSSIHGSCKQ